MATVTNTMPQPSSKKKTPKERVQSIRHALVGMSQLVWGYCGHTGLLTPWHDKAREAFNFQHKTVLKFVDYLEDNDISLEAYSSLVFPVVPYDRYESVGKLLINTGENSWMKKLRKYAGSQDELDYAADIILQFSQLQVEHFGKASLKRSSIVKYDGKAKKNKEGKNTTPLCFEGYYRLIDRIRQLKAYGIDPEIWLEEKFFKSREMFPDSAVQYRTIINVNAVDPDMESLKGKTQDPWRSIRNFLSLSSECELTDGYIPKGWCPSSDDRDETKKITKLDGDGHYYYGDGTQRRGKRHYSSNSYFVIKCTPENFEQFKEGWFDARRFTQNPTWNEYFKWGASPDLWDASGTATTGRGRSVKWRK